MMMMMMMMMTIKNKLSFINPPKTYLKKQKTWNMYVIYIIDLFTHHPTVHTICIYKTRGFVLSLPTSTTNTANSVSCTNYNDQQSINIRL